MVRKEAEKAERKSAEELNAMLLENFISLQKVLVELSSKFDKLSGNISQLLNLFEMSARSFMERPEIRDSEKDKEFLDKLDSLMEQNKTIAKGLTLMEEKIKERVYGRAEPSPPMLPSLTNSQFKPEPASNIKRLPRL